MVAVTGDSPNSASIHMHETLGFSRQAVLRAVGFKLGRWVDAVIMQLALGGGDDTPPVR
jgi:phosphinothricin acetyltransferase